MLELRNKSYFNKVFVFLCMKLGGNFFPSAGFNPETEQVRSDLLWRVSKLNIFEQN